MISKKLLLSIGGFIVFIGILITSGSQSKFVVTEVPNESIKEDSMSEPVTEVEIAQSVEQKETAQETEVKKEETYKVIKVVDGDTLAVSIEGISTTIRLIGLDTPETVDPRKPVQCFGVEASNKAKELLTGQNVKLEYDTSQGTYDKYDRLLTYVYLPDGRLFNKLMIAEGYGYEYTYAIPYKYQKEFKEAELFAQENKKGLWAEGVCEEETLEVSPPTPAQAQETSGSSYGEEYTCSSNAYNCTDFSTHSEAQHVYQLCGGITNDIHRLDRDKDGDACESLPQF
ncbi:MAG: thermonuclease family protein [Candidatus Paceibacterota bacterium]